MRAAGILITVGVLTFVGATALPTAHVAVAAPPQPVFTGDANPAPAGSSFPSAFAAQAGSTVIWWAYDPAIGREPFVYDTVTGTLALLMDIVPGPESSGNFAVSLGPIALFEAAGGASGTQLWRTDGTTAGTSLLRGDLSRISSMTVWNGFSYFSAAGGDEGPELWRSDGTAGGTFQLAAFIPGQQGSVPRQFTAMGEHLYFLVKGGELWRTDGTTAGTEFVYQVDAGIGWLAATPNRLFFTDVDLSRPVTPPHDPILWSSDGTPGGTAPVPDPANTSAVYPSELTVSGDRLFFAARSTATNTFGVWAVDGSAGSTAHLLTSADVTPQQFGIAPTPTGVMFSAEDPVHGIELWKSDGTVATTGFVKDFIAGTDSGQPASLTAMNGYVYFNARTTAEGRELWRTDGTVSGTERLTDIRPGGPDSLVDPSARMSVAGDRLFFSGWDDTHGGEMWFVADVPALPDVPAVPSASAGVLSATVSWSAVPDVPYAPITGYTVTASPGGATCSATATSCVVSGLSAGVPYAFTVAASNRIGSSAVSASSNAVVPTAPSLVPVVPGRVLETRVGDDLKTVDELFRGIGRRSAGSTLELTVAGRANVPADAGAVMVNVTAVAPDSAGFVTVFPCGGDRPNASSVNYQAGQVVPNAVLAKVDVNGAICLFTTAGVDLLVDVNGYVPAGGSPATVLPARLLETRSGPGAVTADGLFQGIGRQPAGGTVELVVAGRGNVPSNASAVMLNVTAVAPDAPGFLTVYPCGQDRPNASSVNYQAGQVVPNAVLAQVGANGAVCVFTMAAADLLVDVNGFVPAGAAPTPVVPARLLETRSGPTLTTVDGQFQGIGRQPVGSVIELMVAGRGNVPAGASAVMVNVTAVSPGGPGFLTVFPCGQTQPGASSVNYQAGQVVANAVLAKIGSSGTICIYTLADADLLVDVTGWT